MYKLGRIYKIIHSGSDAIYVGSTFQSLGIRFSKHLYDNTHGRYYCSIHDLMKKYGEEQFSIELIKEYTVVDQRHLHVYETLWINKLRTCINKRPSFNPIPINIRKQIYWANNMSKLKEQKKEYRKNSLQFVCDVCCGSCRGYKKSRHFTSKKHMLALKVFQGFLGNSAPCMGPRY